MKRLLLAIHDFLSSHRPLALVLLVAMLVTSVFLSLRLHYEEDITEFLPNSSDNEKQVAIYNALADQGRITVIFRPGDEATDDDVMNAIDCFGDRIDSLFSPQTHVEESDAMAAIEEVSHNIALYLTNEDYRRIDSLLSDTTYIATSMAELRQTLSMPLPPMATEMIAADPLGLFSPALERLQALSPSSRFNVIDGYVFDDNGCGYAFLTSPYGSGDTQGNSQMAELLDETLSSMDSIGNVSVTAVGAPLIAVTNANQIKRDSLFATILAVVLIAIILLRTMGRKRNVLWMGFSVACGWLFSLAVIALFNTEISIIVVGIGSVLVGIAVNYPLHYLEHLKEHPDRRETLKEMIEPLVTGNVTTVAAFACLVFVKAEAMRDLGLFASLMLVGTIVFVTVFLPLWAKSGKGSKSAKRMGVKEEEKVGIKAGSRILFWGIVAVTVVLGFFSFRVEFDSDLHNINYMTDQQAADLELLNDKVAEGGLTYVVAEGKSLEEALQRNDSLMQAGVGSLLPSVDRQERAIDGWQRMLGKHPDLAVQVRREARRLGFSERAFMPFYDRLGRHYEPVAVGPEGAVYRLAKDHIVTSDTGCFVVNYVHGDFQRAAMPQGTFAFTQQEVGSSLVNALNDDFNYILYVCSFVVFLFLWLALGRLELALLAFLPMAVGWIWILGLMALTGIKFNIVNIILATFIFGQGDDYTIFITEGLMYEYAYGRKRLREYRRSVIVSALMMSVGIGVLVFARHPAMRSLGAVALVGMASVMLMACYLPPVVFRWMTTKNGKRREVPLTLRRLLCTGWIIFVFVLFVFFIITPYTIVYKRIGRDSERKRERFHRMIYRCAGFALRHLPGVTYRLHNEAGETFKKGAVVIANHQSHLDLLCILSLTPKLVVLTNDWVWRNPVYGAIIRYAEFYPVSNGYDSNMPKLKRLLERGYQVVIFPEGTRSVDGKLGRFHKGAFALAAQCGVDVLPVYLHGNHHVMPKNDIVLRRGAIEMMIGHRVAATTLADDALQAAQQMRTGFAEQYARFRATVETEDYFRPLVRYQYLYKGREVARRRPGEQALLTALAHPAQQYIVEMDNEEDCLAAMHCALRPENLIYRMKR